MSDPFEEINFLARSENRVELLKLLTRGRHTEHELTERTNMSRVTVNRALDAFVERGWARQADDGYSATVIGEVLAEDYTQLAETMDVAARVGPVVDLLPVERMDFDLRELTNATISDPDDYDVLETVDRWITLIRQADRLEVLAYRSGRIVAEPIYEEVSAGSLEMEAILFPSELERIRSDPQTREIKEKLLEAGATYYVADEDPAKPYSLGTFGDVAAITGWNENSKPQVHLESRATPIVEWVKSEYKAAKSAAEPLSIRDLQP